MKKSKLKYWYQTDVYICVLCGKETKNKYRVYNPKPENGDFRFIIYDKACPEHFM